MAKTAPVKKAPLPSLKSVAELLGGRYTDDYRFAFPDVQPPYIPFGYNVLVQLRLPRKKSASGLLILPDDATDAERYRVQSALVRSVGCATFKDRTTGEGWVEGLWYEPGDFVRCPMYGGDRFNVDFRTGDGPKDQVTFAFFKEADAIALVTGNPLDVTTS